MRDDHTQVKAARTLAPLLPRPSGCILSTGTYVGDGATSEQLQRQMDGYTALSYWSGFPAVRHVLSNWLKPVLQQDPEAQDWWLTYMTMPIAIAFWARSMEGTEGGSIQQTYLTDMRSVCNRFQTPSDVAGALYAAQRRLITKYFPHNQARPANVTDLEEVLSAITKIHSPLGTYPTRATTVPLTASAQFEDDGHAITDLCLRRPTLATFVGKETKVPAILYAKESMWNDSEMRDLATVVRRLSAHIHSHRHQTEYLSGTYPPTSAVNERLRSGHQYGSICDYIEPLNLFAERLERPGRS